MASRSLGSLTVDVIAQVGGFVSGMDKAEREALKKSKAIQKAFDDAATGIGIAAGLAVTGFVAALAGLQSAVKYVGDFQDLADKTGASAEGLASFAVAAGTAGVSMDEIASASVKLTKSLTGVDDESKAVGAALKFLNINIEDFKNLSPEDQYDQLAKSLGEVESKTDQVALATDLWGKSGAEQLKVVNALNEQGGRQVILTAEMIKLADDAADAQAKATAQLKLYGSVLAVQAIPYVTAFTGAVTDSIKEMIGLDKGLSDLKNNKAVQEFAESAVRSLAFVVDAVDGVIRVFNSAGKGLGALAASAAAVVQGDLAGAASALKEGAADIDGILNRELFSTKVDRRLAELKKNQQLAGQENRGFTPSTTPGRSYAGSPSKAKGGGADAAKIAADAEVKALERQINQERDLMADRNKMLDLYNSQGLISISDYYAQRKTILEEGTRAQVSALDEQIKVLQAYAAKAKPEQRASATEKVNELLDKQAKLQRDLGIASIESEFQRKKATDDYQKDLRELNAQILELQGNLVEAANIRFDDQNAERLKRFAAEGNAEAKQQLAYLKQVSAAQAGIGQAQDKIGRQRTELQRQEERIARDQQLGITGQIDGLVKLGEARKQALSGMQQALSELNALQANGTQLTSAQKDSIKDLTNQIEDLSTQLDPLGEKFNTMFADKFGDAFASIIDGTKSVKQALKDMVNSFVSDLVKLAAQDVFKSLLSGGGSATGGAGFNLGGLLSSLFAGARANGGPVMPNSLYRVNERGPELFEAANGNQFLMTGASGGKVHPNSSGTTIQQNVYVQGTPNNRTITQMAQETRRQTNAAQRRFS